MNDYMYTNLRNYLEEHSSLLKQILEAVQQGNAPQASKAKGAASEPAKSAEKPTEAKGAATKTTAKKGK